MKKVLYSLFLVLVLISSCSILNSNRDHIKGDQQFDMMNYAVAVDHYEIAWEREEIPQIARGLANSYFSMREFDLAESWYGKLDRMEEELTAGDRINFAKTLIANSKFEEAKRQLELYAEDEEADQEDIYIKNLALTANNAKDLLNSPKSVQIKSLGELNTEFADFGAFIIEDRLLFATDKVEGSGNGRINAYNALKSDRYGWTGNNYLQVYEAKGDWDKFEVENVYQEESLKSRHHSGPVYEDQNFIFITRSEQGNEKLKNPLFRDVDYTLYPRIVYKEFKDSTWGQEKELPVNKPMEYSVSDPFWDAPNERLYFSSDKEGGFGDSDIYYMTYLGDDKWSEPVNLGDGINTAGNERTPFIDTKGNFYFSSDGLGGLGGLDIFKSEKEGDRWGKPENLGAPINSTRDDFFYHINAKIPDRGVLSSDREGGRGLDDIYAFVLDIESKIYLQGVVRDKSTLEPLENAVVELIDKTTGTNFTYVTDEEGKFDFLLNEETDYDLEGKMTDYITAEIKDINTKGMRIFEDTTIVKDLLLDKIEVGKTIVLENIYYDFDKWDIREDAALELDKLVRILNDNPTMKIELNSHTDSRGSDSYNQTLSERRAQSAVDYIISQGISQSRMEAKGYGESRPVNHCINGVDCTEEEHQDNRRTEFTIVDY